MGFCEDGPATTKCLDVIIFDLFGVILLFNDDLVTRRLADHCANPPEAYIALRDIVSNSDLICGKLTLSDLHRKLVSIYGLSLSFSEFNQSWLIPYSQPMPGALDLIKDLAVRHTLVLLSNVDKYYWETIRENHEELKYFAHLILSWEVGAAKPDEEIFYRAMDAAGAEASKCYFIDDKLENVNAAIRLGIQAHHFTNLNNLKETLAKRGAGR